jgi:hypothetical protein
MKTNELFQKIDSKKINESLEKTFGQKINFETFDLHQLQDARNKLRTQISQVRGSSTFNETIESEAYTKAQWMLDAINAEISERGEFIIDGIEEDSASFDNKIADLLKRFDDNANEIGAYGDPDTKTVMALLKQGDVEGAIDEVWNSYSDQDGGEVPRLEPYVEDLQAEFEELASDADTDIEGGDTDDAYALASAGYGSDEDYGDYGQDEAIETEAGRSAYERDYDASISGMDGDSKRDFKRAELQHELGHERNNIQVSINGKPWKVFAGKGTADSPEEYRHLQSMKSWAERKSAISGKKWSVSLTGANPTENIEEKAPPTAKGERMVKHIKTGYAKDGKLTDKERSIAYATAWKQHNKNESIEQTGDDMHNLREGEIQQASAIVTAKTMVDRVGRWIEELSGMENDTLLQLGDSIRDEMGQEQAKNFISAVAPAIQAALENLKTTRETLATGVRTLTGEEQGAEMLGAEAPATGEEMPAAEPDTLNAEPAGGEDEFAAAEPAVGGAEEAGREQRESIQYQSRLLKVLAG